MLRARARTERQVVGRLGGDPTAPYVVSRRSTQEKQPWKSLPAIEHRVEVEFLRTVLLGESILPYRVFNPFEGVISAMPNGTVLDAQAAANRGYSGLHGYLSAAESVWNENSESGTMKLVQRWNYHNELGAQFPIPEFRVVYAASGTIPAACALRQSSAVIEHGLYWASATTQAECDYLVSILNSETARERVAALQARGQWGARHFDKVVFTLPIPPFDSSIPLHVELAEAAREAERFASTVAIPESVKFQRARKLIRDALIADGIVPRIEMMVARLLDG